MGQMTMSVYDLYPLFAHLEENFGNKSGNSTPVLRQNTSLPRYVTKQFFFFHYSMFMTLSVVAEGIVKALVMMMIMMFS